MKITSLPRKTCLLAIVFVMLFVSNTLKAADYYWKGGTGVWTDLTHWVTTSGGSTNHTIVPTPIDNVIFDANSFTASGGTVTVNFQAFCNNFTVTSGVGANVIFQFNSGLVASGSINATPSSNLTWNQASLLQAASGITMSRITYAMSSGNVALTGGNLNLNTNSQFTFNSNSTYSFTLSGTGSTIVLDGTSKFLQGSNAPLNINGAITVPSGATFTSNGGGAKNLNVGGLDMQSGSIGTFNGTWNIKDGGFKLNPTATVTFNGGNIYFQATTSGTHYIQCGGRDIRRIELNGSSVNAEYHLLDKLTALSDGVWIYANKFYTDGNQVNAYYFYSWTSTPVTIDVTGTDTLQVAYQFAMYPSSTTNFIAGNSVIKFQGTNHFYFTGGNKKYNDLVFNSTSTGDIQIYLEYNDTLRDVYMNGQGRQYLRMYNNHVIRNFYYNHLNASANSSGLTSMDIYGNLTVTGEFKYTSASLNMRPKWNFYGLGTINVLNWNSAISEWAIGNTQTITDLKPIIGTCARTIVLRSMTAGSQRIISQATGTVTADWVLIQDLKGQGGATFTATNAIDLGNNAGWTITPIAAQNFYWIGGAGNWNDPNHWSLTSGGTAGCAIPSRIDSVFFDANSFTASGQFCTINANAECKNMIWDNIATGAGMNGSSATMSIYGSLKLDAPMNYSFSGQLIFQSKTIGNTIETEGRTITGSIDFQCQNTSAAEYTLLDNLKTTSSVTLTYGKFFSGGKDLDIYSFIQSSGTGTVANFTGTALIKLQNQWYSYVNGTLVMPLTTELRFEGVNSHYFYSYGSNSANKKTYGKVVFNSTGTAGYDMYAWGNYNNIANMQVNYAGNYRYYNEMHYSVWDTLAINFTNPTYSDNVYATMAGQYDTLNYFSFKSTGAIRPRLQTYYWFKANNFVVQNFYEWAHNNPSPQPYFGNITLLGSCNPKMIVRGSSSATQSIINCTGTATADNCIIKDIKIQGGGTYSTTNSADGGNTTGWGTFGTGTNYYWVGGAGNWSDGSHWSLSPGGAGSGCVPSQADNVFFDVNSFTAANQTVNVNITAKFKNMLWSGVNNPILGGNQTMECFGSLTLASNMTWNNTNILYFNSRNTGNTIKTGNVRPYYVYFNGDGTTSGGWILQDSLNVINDIYFRAGNFVSNGYNVTARQMNNDVNSSLITMNFTGTKELKVNYQFITQPSTIVIMDTALIKFNYNGNHLQFDGGNHVFKNIEFNISAGGAPNINMTGNNTINNVTFNNAGSPIVNISGNTTFNDINFVNTNTSTNIPQLNFNGTNNINTLSVNSTGNGGPWLTLNQNNTFNSLIAAGLGTRLYLGAGRTQTVNSVLALGNGSYPVIVQSTTSGTQGTIYKPTGQVCLDYVLMKDTKGDGVSTQFFAGASSVNLGNNTNWIFSSCNAYYWVGGSGNWTDAANHWATSSGGTTFQSAPPGPSDNVFFDANSFTLAGQTVTVNTATASCKNMKWASAAFNPTFTGNTDLDIYGDLELINGMNQNFTGNWNFKAGDTAGRSLNPANKSMTNVNFIGGTSGIGKWTLQNPLTVSNNLNFDNGTLISNNKNITTKNFNSTTANTRSLQLGSSLVTIFNGTWNPSTLTNATLVEGTSTILIGGATGSFLGNNLTYNNLTFDGSPVMAGTLTGTNTFNNLTLADGTNLSVEATSTQTMSSLVANATCGNPIYLQSTVSGTQANFSKSSGIVNIQFLNIKDMKAQGGATYNAKYSADLGNNTGWNFTSSPLVIDANVSSTYVSCTSNNNGTATVDTVIGGIPPYTYLWSNSLTTRTITNLIPGTYTVTVTDSAGCFVVKTINVSNSPSTITAVPFTASSLNVCLGTAINFTAGTPAQAVTSYLWNFGDFSTSTLQNPSKTYSAAGTYTVTLSYIDASGCPATISAIIKVSNVAQSVLATNVLCRGDNNGSITITASNGVPPYQYTINNSTYVSTNSFTNLVPGTYQVRTKDSIGCMTSVQNFTITQPSAILAFTASTVGVSCAGNGDGSLTITASGGTPPYNYSINNGILYVGTNLFSNLTSGTYNVIVRDANACVTAVQNITIGVSDNVMPTITCPGNITVAGSGGCTQAVTVSVPSAADNCGVASVLNNFNGTANASGNYPVGVTTVVWTVTDVNNNTATCSMTVTVTGPEISVLGNSATIADGDVTPSVSDHTDFGSVQLGQNFVRTFAIKNNGTTNLTINSLAITGTNASDFTIPAISLPVTISAGNTLALPVTFTPAALNLRTATVEVGSDDCDEPTYDFAIQGTGICATPIAYNVTGTGSYCAGGTGVAVGLSNSQTGINYQLMLGASPIGSPVAGTGSSINFGNQTTAGTYTVVATNTIGNCTNNMTGSAVVTINPLPTPVISASGPTTFCSGGSVNLSTGGISSLDFNGTNGYVTIPHSAGQVATQMTMEAWVYVRSTTAGGANILMKGSYGYGIHLGNDGCTPGNKLGYWVNSGCGSTILSTGTVPFNQWAHVAVVVTTSPTQTLNFYINGVAAGSSTSSSITINNGGNQPLILGMQGTSCACNYYNGKMDEVRIWNTALTQAQIVANMNSTVSPSSSNLQVYLRADNASGTTATDLSVNGTNGTLVNGMSWEVPSSSPIGGYASYVWNPGGATTPSINVNNSGTYSVAVTDVNGCSATSASTTVTVNPLPSVFNVTGGGSYCSGGTGVAVGLDASQTGINYQLKINGSNIGSPIAGTGSALSFGNQTTAGTYTIVATNATTNCTSTMTGSVTVIVNPLPTVFAVTGGGSYCSGGTGVVVGLAGSQTGINYQLMNGASAVGSPVAGTNAAISFGNQTAAGTYTVVATNATTNCTANMSGSVTVTVNPLPVITPTSDQTLCANTSTSAINFSSSISGSTFAWTNTTPSIGLAASGTGNIPSFTALNTGAIPVTATVVVTPTSPGVGGGSGGSGIAYIANYSSASVTVVNSATNAVITTINVGSGPYAVGVTPDGSRVYVANRNSNTVSVINTATNTVSATISGLGSTPTGIAIAPDGSKVYVTNESSQTVSVINTATNTVTATIGVGQCPRGIAMSPDGSRVYSCNICTNNISVINTSTNTVIATIAVGSSPNDATVTLDNSKVYVANNGASSVSVINTSTNTVSATISVGSSPWAVMRSADATKVYVSNMSSNTVSVINTATNTVSATISGTFSCPGGMSFAPNGTDLMVTNVCSNNVTKVNTTTNTITSTTSTGTSPYSVGFFMQPGGGTGCAGTPDTFTITVNPTPFVYNVTGGGAYCNGGSGSAVGLSNSQTGVNYQLMLGSSPVGSPVAGTGSAISFGNQTTAGTYTVVATQTAAGNCVATMNGNATVTITTINNQAVAASTDSVCSGTGTTVSVTSTQTGVSYVLRNDANNAVVAGPINGTGSAINFNTGALSSTTTYNVLAQTTAGTGGAIDFDGVNDAVFANDASQIDFTSQYTAEAMIYVKGYQYGTIVAKFEDDGNNRGWMINMGETGDNTKLCVVHSQLGTWTNPIQWNTGFTPALNTWYHIAVTFDGTLGSNNIKLYVNGTLQAQTTWAFTMTANAARLYVGGYDGSGNGMNAGANSRFFRGSVDELRLWNTVRTQPQIQSNMNSCLTGSESGLAAYYKFDDAAGTTAVDSKSGNNGTLTNMNTSTAWVAGNLSCGGATCNLQMTTKPTVTVKTAPVFTACPSNISTNNDAGSCNAVVNYTASTSAIPAANITYAFTGATTGSGNGTGDGSTFNKGITNVTITATNSCGTATCTFTVTVTDNENPVIACNSNITQVADAGVCGGVINFTAPVGTDNCTGSTTAQTAGLASGSTFPLGTTTNTFVVTDASGNTATCSFDVTIVAPEINVTGNSNSIVDGDNTPSSTDHTDFGGTNPGVPVTKTYTIENSGTSSLTVSSIGMTGTDASSFTVGGITLPATVTVGSSTTFTVTFNETSLGIKDATVNVVSDDCNEATYDYAVRGEITCAPASFTSCPSNISTTAAVGQCNEVVNYTATTNGTPAANITYTFTGATTGSGNGTGSGATFNVGITTVTINATNPCSNVNCTFTVTVTDDEDPVITAPANIAVNNDAGVCGAVVTYTTPVGTDNCPGSTTAQTAGLASGSTFPIGTTTNTFVVTDAHGNTATASFDIVVTDTENPTIAGLSNIAVNNDNGICGAVVNYTAPVGVDNCPGATTVQTAGLASGSTFPIGTTTNTFVVTDAYGHTATTSFDVVVTDAENPTIAALSDINVNNDANVCGAVVNYTAPVGVDNCPGATTLQTAGLASGSTFPIGTTTNTFVVTDAYGHTATTSFNVVVTDTQVPVLTGVPANATVSCEDVPAPPVVTASDNCSVSLPVTYSQVITNGYLPPSGLKGFWNFNENSGTTTADQTSNGNNGTLTSGVNWVAGQSGSAVQMPGTSNSYVNMPNTNGALDTRYSVSMFAWYWPGTNGSQQNPIIQYNANGWGTHLWQTGANQLFVRFTARGSLAFTTALAANVLTPNQWNCVGATYDYNTGVARLWCNGVNVQTLNIGVMQLSTNYPVRVGSVDFDGRRTNSKVDNVAIYDRALSASEIAQLCAVTCPQSYVITRTWSTTDAHNNTTTASQTVTVKDTTAPVLTVPANIALNNQSGMCSAVANFQATATDNCSNNLTITYSQNSGTAFPVGTTTVTVTAKDECGNTSTGTFTVTVTDNEVPSITCAANIAVNNNTGICGAVVTYTTPVGTDNCPGATTVQTAGLPSGSTFPVGTTTNTFVVTDAHSNTNTCSFTVTVTDNEQPAISIAGVTVNADNGSCAATNVNLGTPTTSDNCAVDSTWNDALASYPVGNTTVTWNVRDIHGNTNSTTQTITVLDNQNPIVNTQDITVYLDASGTVSITAADINNNSTDNCGIQSMSVSPSTFDCSKVGENGVVLTVNDIHGNTASANAVVTVVDTVKPVITCPAAITVSCLTAPSNTGTATATDACGAPVITYTDASTYSANPADAAHYNYTITRTWTATDANDNSSSCTQIITVQQLKLTAAITNVACYGTATGSIDLTVQGGVGALTYAWSNSATTQDISGLILGTYTVTVTDTAGCTATASYTVTQPTLLVTTAINVSPNPTVAAHAMNTIYLGYGPQLVTLSSVASGGTPGYTYSWTPTTGVANPTAASTLVSPVVTTTYTLTVTDANGCTVSVNKTIYVQDVTAYNNKVKICHNGNTLSVSASAIPAHLAHGDHLGTCFEVDGVVAKVSCYGGNNGAVNITVTGSVAPYTYLWSNGATTEDISGLTSGTYNVLVTSANGETTTASFYVNQYSKIAINSTQYNVKCYGDSSASIYVNVSGGNDPYTYTWNNSTSTNKNRYNLPIGTYIVTVTDDNGCTMRDTTVITQPSAPLAITGVIAHVKCNGDETGGVDITVTGGAGPYSYDWDDEDNNSYSNNHSHHSCNHSWNSHWCSHHSSHCNNNAQDLSGVDAGTYSVTVTDANGCEKTVTFTITEPAEINLTSVKTNVSCNGGNNGAIDLTVSGGKAPYTYLWNGGVTTQDRIGLTAGTYSVTVTDSNNCTKTLSVTISQPSQLVLTTSKTNVSCNGGNNGSINLTVTGGTAPYTYLWSNSATTQDISSLFAGTYSVTVTDSKGCTATATVTITQPTQLVASGIVTHVACNGDDDGAIDVTVSGGTGPYSYNWNSNGGGHSYHSCSSWWNNWCSSHSNWSSCHQHSQDVSGIEAGTYSVVVTDANGCTVTLTFTVNQPAALSIAAVKTNVSCNGGNNGSVTGVTVTGGTAPYTYKWNNNSTVSNRTGLTAGTYTLTVTDANGCAKTVSYSVTQPAVLAATTQVSNVSCNSSVNGGVNLTVTGGTAPYTYLWSNSATTQDITGLVAGTYTVAITDSNGCTLSKSATVTQPAVLTINRTITNVSCYGDNDGEIDVAVTGGTPSYSYTWDNNMTCSDRSGLTAGNYSLTVRDANNCSQTVVMTVTQPTQLNVTGVVTNVTCNNGNNGAINITATGGTAPYTYKWNNNSTAEDRTGLVAGTYTVKVKDANDCEKTVTFTVTQPTSITASIAVNPNPTVSGQAQNTIFKGYGPSSVTLTASVSGGTPGYTYSWTPTAGVANPTSASTSVTPAVTTTYTVTITDANGCTKTTTKTIVVIDVTNGNLIKVCHNNSTISVTPSTVASHLAHGDDLGSCGSTCKSCPPEEHEEEQPTMAVLGIKELKVFPNPNTGKFKVEIPDGIKGGEAVIMDMAGKVIQRVRFMPDVQLSFDLEDVARGVYMVQIKNGDNTYRALVSVQQQ